MGSLEYGRSLREARPEQEVALLGILSERQAEKLQVVMRQN